MLLHSFGTEEETPGGSTPFATLARDVNGNLYGTTFYGGTHNAGVVFRLDEKRSYSVLYNFPSAWGAYNWGPLGPLTLDDEGNLYGAGAGGKYSCNNGSCGMVFKLDPSDGNLTILHAFEKGKDGIYPNAGLILDSAGNLFGTTSSGGDVGGHGAVYELDAAGEETVLYEFGKEPDGTNPEYGLVKDSTGNFYGTTQNGGLRGCPDGEGPMTCGTVFKVDPSGSETVLYLFTGKADGGNPIGGLVIDSAGNLYGTAGWGQFGHGVIFKVDPAGTKASLMHLLVARTGLARKVGWQWTRRATCMERHTLAAI